MRERWWALMLIPALMLSLAACTGVGRSDVVGRPATLYFEKSEMGTLETEAVVGTEQRFVAAESLLDFLNLYFEGPQSDTLLSPFPPKTRALESRLEGDELELCLSGEFFTLTGVDLTLACCCLSRTARDYTGCRTVVLVDETDSIRIQADPDSYILSGGLRDDAGESYAVYFSDQDHRYLIQENRSAILSHNESAYAFVLRRLLDGPDSKQLLPVLPEGTDLRSVKTQDGLCTVDLSGEFVTERTGDVYADYTAIYGIVNTLTALEDVDRVQLLVDGVVMTHYGIFNIAEPLTRNEQCIGPVRMAGSESDVNLYVRSIDGQDFAVPCRVRQTISEPLAQAVLETLLDYEPPQGFVNLIPEGTSLISVSMFGSRCEVDLSERFIPREDSPEAESAAVCSLVSTLTWLDGVDSVLVTIGGESSGLNYVDISEPLYGSNHE